jgi:hypothetical protein
MADNLNTVYLSTPSVGAINQTSAASTVLSDLSVSGTIDAGALDSAGAVAVTGTTTATGGLLVGAGQGTLSVMSTSLQSVAALTINDYESGQTTFTDNWAALGDVVIATPLDSDLSNGLAYNAYVSAASTVCLRFSNVSSVEAKPVAQSWRFTLLRFS